MAPPTETPSSDVSNSQLDTESQATTLNADCLPSFHAEPQEKRPKKPRRWILILAGIVLAIGVFATYNMYRDADNIDKIFKNTSDLRLPDQNQTQISHTDPALRYTILLPPGWKPMQEADKPLYFYGPPVNNRTPNLYLKEETFHGNFETFLKAKEAQKKLFLNGYKLIQSSFITTKTGIKMSRNVHESVINDNPYRHIYYYSQRADKLFFVCIATVPQGIGDEFDTAFDKSIESLQLLP